MHSRRRRSKPVELAFRDKPESYQAAYRNLVRVFIDDNLTEAFIDRLMPFSSVAAATPAPAMAASVLTPAMPAVPVPAPVPAAPVKLLTTGSTFKFVNSFSCTDESTCKPILKDTPDISYENTFGQLQAALLAQYPWIDKNQIELLIIDSTDDRNPTLKQLNLNSRLTEKISSEVTKTNEVQFVPSLMIFIQHSNGKQKKYRVSGSLSFNMFANELYESFGAVVNFFSWDTEETRQILKTGTDGDLQFIPFNLAVIQKTALNGRPWNCETNPLDQPIFQNKHLWEYLHKNVSFLPATGPAVQETINNLEICVTYGNPQYDARIVMRSSDLQSDDLEKTISDKLPESFRALTLKFKDSPETLIEKIICEQKVHVAVTVNVNVNGNYADGFYSDSTKEEVLDALSDRQITFTTMDPQLTALKNTDKLASLDLRTKSTLEFS